MISSISSIYVKYLYFLFFKTYLKNIATDNIIHKNIYILQISSPTYDTSDTYKLDIPDLYILYPYCNLFVSAISQNHPQSTGHGGSR